MRMQATTQLELRLISGDINVVSDKAKIDVNPNKTIYSVGTYFLGMGSLNLSVEVGVKIGLSLLPNFTLQTTQSVGSSIGVWYLLVERHPKFFC